MVVGLEVMVEGVGMVGEIEVTWLGLKDESVFEVKDSSKRKT